MKGIPEDPAPAAPAAPAVPASGGGGGGGQQQQQPAAEGQQPAAQSGGGGQCQMEPLYRGGSQPDVPLVSHVDLWWQSSDVDNAKQRCLISGWSIPVLTQSLIALSSSCTVHVVVKLACNCSLPFPRENVYTIVVNRQ